MTAETENQGMTEVEDLVIIGGGMAGFTAAMYAGRAAIKPLVILGNALGGQTAMTESMENYPGFPDGIGGTELAESVQAQAEKFGARLEYDLVESVDFSARPFTLKTASREIRAHAVIIATGAQPRRLNIAGERKFLGRGVSFCATCDGYFYRGKVVAVIGGGNSALEEGMYLARLVEKVYVIHRRDEFRADRIIQERARQNPKMEFLMNTVVDEIRGDSQVETLATRNLVTGETRELKVDGVFEFVGLTPNTALFAGQLALDEAGYIVTDKHQRTNIEGVFAAGDVQSPFFRQVVVAAGTGAAAAIEAARYLDNLEGAA
jgi:thioredoxin reductase (NADPH)